jgi:hypothetical protein
MEFDNPIALTMEEHRQLGAQVSEAHVRLAELCKLIVTVYGPTNRASFSFLKTMEAMDRLCQDLQTQAIKDLPGYRTEGLYL